LCESEGVLGLSSYSVLRGCVAALKVKGVNMQNAALVWIEQGQDIPTSIVEIKTDHEEGVFCLSNYTVNRLQRWRPNDVYNDTKLDKELRELGIVDYLNFSRVPTTMFFLLHPSFIKGDWYTVKTKTYNIYAAITLHRVPQFVRAVSCLYCDVISWCDSDCCC